MQKKYSELIVVSSFFLIGDEGNIELLEIKEKLLPGRFQNPFCNHTNTHEAQKKPRRFVSESLKTKSAKKNLPGLIFMKHIKTGRFFPESFRNHYNLNTPKETFMQANIHEARKNQEGLFQSH